MLFGFDFSLIALIDIILLIGIVKKNGIMMVVLPSSPNATRICRRKKRSAKPRCCAFGLS
jgi:multidrug efflux pump subunit AcrB